MSSVLVCGGNDILNIYLGKIDVDTYLFLTFSIFRLTLKSKHPLGKREALEDFCCECKCR